MIHLLHTYRGLPWPVCGAQRDDSARPTQDEAVTCPWCHRFALVALRAPPPPLPASPTVPGAQLPWKPVVGLC